MANLEKTTPRIGEVRYCTKTESHVLVKDLILGNGICDVVCYYIREQSTRRVDAKYLVKNIGSPSSLQPAKAERLGLHPAYTNKMFRRAKMNSFNPITTWSKVHARKSLKDVISKMKTGHIPDSHKLKEYIEKVKKKYDVKASECVCNMELIMRDGCQCGGV